MGILTANKKTKSRDVAKGEQTTLVDHAGGRRDMPQPAAATPTDLFSVLPSPPAPCPTCGTAILWIPTTLDAWRCPTCFPPPIQKMVAARVVLVDVEFGTSPQWFKLYWIERDGRRSLATTPIRCAANGTALVDAACVAGGGGSGREFIQDDRLGPPLVDGVRVDDEAWWAIGSSEVVWKQFFEAVGKK